MNHNAALPALTTRVATHPALVHPLAGRIASLYTGWIPRFDRHAVRIQIAGDDRAVLGKLIAWAYQPTDPTVRLDSYEASVHVQVYGLLDGDPVEVYAGTYDTVADELRSHVVWDGDRAATSVHHLRAVQVGTYRTAVAA